MAVTPIKKQLLIARVKPSRATDQSNPDAAERGSPFNEQFVVSPVPFRQALADEGSLFSATMLPSATILQLGLAATFVATTAAFVLTNKANPLDPNAPTCFLDYIHMIVGGTVPTSASAWAYATVLDTIDRSPTTVVLQGGSAANGAAYTPTVFNNNSGLNPRNAGVPFFPLSTTAGAPPTVPAASANARTIVGNGQIRSTIPVIGDDYRIVFGAGDTAPSFGRAATIMNIVEPHPEVAIAPGNSFLLYMWGLSNVTAGITFSGFDVGWIER